MTSLNLSSNKKTVLGICIILLITVMSLFDTANARMLPTRSNEDQLDKLRELLRDILETESDYHPKVSNSLIEKRQFQDKDMMTLEDYKNMKEYPMLHAPSSRGALTDKDLRYMEYKRSLPLRFYGLMKNNGDD
uniref:CSON003257 protein n=1 Tax=Culicoides sonorensis TaxID=179676 RepID=A0A336MKY3_CULSO